jgi:hypothetical protein
MSLSALIRHAPAPITPSAHHDAQAAPRCARYARPMTVDHVVGGYKCLLLHYDWRPSVACVGTVSAGLLVGGPGGGVMFTFCYRATQCAGRRDAVLIAGLRPCLTATARLAVKRLESFNLKGVRIRRRGAAGGRARAGSDFPVHPPHKVPTTFRVPKKLLSKKSRFVLVLTIC